MASRLKSWAAAVAALFLADFSDEGAVWLDEVDAELLYGGAA